MKKFEEKTRFEQFFLDMESMKQALTIHDTCINQNTIRVEELEKRMTVLEEHLLRRDNSTTTPRANSFELLDDEQQRVLQEVRCDS